MKSTLFLIFGMLMFFSFGQQEKTVDFLRKYELDSVALVLPKCNKDLRTILSWQVDFLNKFDFSTDVVEHPKKFEVNGLYEKFYQNINEGDFLFYSFEGENLKSLKEYQEALKLAKGMNNRQLICEALKRILTLHRIHYLYDNKTYVEYLEAYKENAYDSYEKANYHYYNLILTFKNYYTDHWQKESYLWLNKYFEGHQAPYLKARVYNVYASYFEEMEDFDKVEYFIKKADEEFAKIPYNYKKTRVNQLMAFAARISARLDQVEKLENYLKRFDTAVTNKTDHQFKSLYHYYSSVLDTMRGNYKSAYGNYYKYEVSQDSIRSYRYDDLLNDLETKYQTAEKEKQILEEQQKARTTRNWLIATGLALLFGTGIAILLQKNTTKKRQLAEQQALLKQERVDNLLKEQELVSIDAMIEGQEKERQRVANELHDDLGSLMATIKLHFDNSKVSKKDPALQNAQKLLEEAYQKVRGMAHSKNSGVMSDQGLLSAIKKMAKVITKTNALEVRVEDFGMGERLENSLELNLFRMVQELVANAIKHAEATKVNIQLTQHEDNLNIIIEDDGKGFDRTKVDTSKTGMGLTTIEKRVEHLEGNFTVDSVLGKGTSILIDIPV